MIFIVFVKMFFFPRYVFFFLSLDAKTLPPPKKKKTQTKKTNATYRFSLFLFMSNKFGISMQLFLKYPFEVCCFFFFFPPVVPLVTWDDIFRDT